MIKPTSTLRWLLRQPGLTASPLAWVAQSIGWRGAMAGFAGLMVAPPGAPLPGWTVLCDRDGLLRQRYDARPGTTYLIRPDRYVATRWRTADGAALASALRRATATG